MLGRAAIYAAWVAIVSCAVGCKLETKAIPATQLVVDVHADAIVRDRTDNVQVEVWSANRRNAFDDKARVMSRTVPASAPASEDAFWPMRLVFAPRHGDATRVFELSVTSRDPDGDVVTVARVMTGFIEHEARYASVRLEMACMGVMCQAGRTCHSGTCEDAWRDPKRLPFPPGRAPRPDNDLLIDAGGDASVDASIDPVDARAADGGADSGVDAGADSVDHCAIGNGGCDPLVTCENTGSEVLCGLCPDGFEDANGDGTRCIDIDECKFKNGGCDVAHGKCTNMFGGYLCECTAGYFGDGKQCSVNVPCGADAKVCDSRATCVEMDAQRVCLCEQGFAGDGVRCSDIDECTQKPDRCGAHATCVNTEGAFECKCDAGYALTDGACSDVDECAANTDNCTNRPDACVNTPGGFLCKCPKGYTGPAMGSEGCNDTDECYEHMANCSENANCMNTRGSFTCKCKDGFEGDGVKCKSKG